MHKLAPTILKTQKLRTVALRGYTRLYSKTKMRGGEKRVEVQFTQCKIALKPNHKTLGLKKCQHILKTCLIKLIISKRWKLYIVISRNPGTLKLKNHRSWEFNFLSKAYEIFNLLTLPRPWLSAMPTVILRFSPVLMCGVCSIRYIIHSMSKYQEKTMIRRNKPPTKHKHNLQLEKK